LLFWVLCEELQLKQRLSSTSGLPVRGLRRIKKQQRNQFMNTVLVLGVLLAWVAILAGVWLGWQLLRQNGRILLQLDELEDRLDKLEFGEDQQPMALPIGDEANGEGGVPPGEGVRANRFANRTLTRSKIKRDGLKAGTPAPEFRLPRLDGRGELALSDLRGRRLLLAFSSPGCGPCNALAPELEKFHRAHPELEVIMISKGEPRENRAKVKEHGLTFPIVLQQQWEISRRYAMFATPIAYLIDEQGVIVGGVALGADAILTMLSQEDGSKKRLSTREPAVALV
jgi:peroxiredoxin